MLCLMATVQNLGVQGFPLNSLLDPIVKLLEDPHQSVREAAAMCLEEVFREVGEPLRDWIQQQNLRPALLSSILDRFEATEVRPGAQDYNVSAAALRNDPAARTAHSPKASAPASTLKKLDVKKSPKPTRPTGSTVAPVKVVSERELTNEMEEIALNLASVDIDWNVRLRTLQRLQGLVYGGAANLPSFLSLLPRLKEPLSVQISDLRSAIAKEACQTLVALSAALGDAFEPYADIFIDLLLKLTIVTIQVISASANQCIRSILQQTRLNRGITKILECAAGKNGVMRTRCMEYLLLLLRVMNVSGLERHADQIEAVIKNGVGDAVPEVRANARACYVLFSQHWDNRGTRLLASMEPNVRRLIGEEMSKGEPGSDPDTESISSRYSSRRPSAGLKGSASTVTRPSSSPASQSSAPALTSLSRFGKPFAGNLKRAGSDSNIVIWAGAEKAPSASAPVSTPTVPVSSRDPVAPTAATTAPLGPANGSATTVLTSSTKKVSNAPQRVYGEKDKENTNGVPKRLLSMLYFIVG